jgi:hypothetical protein
MREIRQSGSMRGCRRRTEMYRACVLLYSVPHQEDDLFLLSRYGNRSAGV